MVRRKKQVVYEEPLSMKFTEFLRECKARNLSERTIEQYRLSIEKFIEVCGDLEEVGSSDIINFIESFDQSPGTVNYYLRGLRTFLNHCQLNLKVPLVEGMEKAIIPFTAEQVKKILGQINIGTFVGMRDYTMYLLLYDTGMRIGELSRITREHIIGDHILISGKAKGKKERIVPLGVNCCNTLNKYLHQVKELTDEQPIFITENYLPIQRQQVLKRLKHYADKAGIKGVRVSPHTFRHSFALTYLMNGGDIYTLQAILGHKSLEMVKKYLCLSEQDIKGQHKKYSPSDNLFWRKKK